MFREHDERAKLIAEQTLDLLGEVKREVEIPTSDAQRLDIWLDRIFFPTELPPFLRLLSDLLPTRSVLELFSEALRLHSFWESHRKQYAWRHYLEGKERERAKSEGQEPPPSLEPPWMWLVSAGRPEALLARYRLAPWSRCPQGIYTFDEGWCMGLIVVSELPPGPETLLLRLMGSPPVRREALKEIGRLPEGDPDRPKLLKLVASLQHTFKRATTISQEEKDEFMTAAMAEVELFAQHQRQEGRQEGLRASIRDFCDAFNIPLPEERLHQLEQMDATSLDQLLKYLFHNRAWPTP